MGPSLACVWTDEVTMERHAEIVRQWRLALEGRARALTLQELQQAAGEAVSERPSVSNLNALAQAASPSSQRRWRARRATP